MATRKNSKQSNRKQPSLTPYRRWPGAFEHVEAAVNDIAHKIEEARHELLRKMREPGFDLARVADWQAAQDLMELNRTASILEDAPLDCWEAALCGGTA